MAVPDFQSPMLPLLRVAADGREHSLAEARETLAVEFKPSDVDRDEPLPSGRQPKFSNRVAWAKSYLQQAGLLSSLGAATSKSRTEAEAFSVTHPRRSTSSFSNSTRSSSSSGRRRARRRRRLPRLSFDCG